MNFSDSETITMVVYKSDLDKIFSLLKKHRIKNGRQLNAYPKDVVRTLLFAFDRLDLDKNKDLFAEVIKCNL